MKKRTGTKALSIALAAALCMTGLAGCGSKTQETQGSTAAKTEAGETPAELKPVTLKLWSSVSYTHLTLPTILRV